MKIIQKKDYDTNYSINDRDIKCYSKKKINDLYPDGNFEIVGETFENNKKDKIDKIKIAQKELVVSEYGKNSKIKYSKKYFICVGKDKYLCLLKSRFFILALLLLILGIIIGILLSIFIYFHTPTLKPDYPLPNEDDKSTKIDNDNSQKVKSEEGGSARVRLSNVAKVNLSTGKIKMLYQNPNQSNQDSVISLVLINNGNEYIIARSGLIKTGRQISEMKLNANTINLTEGVYKGKYVVDHYNPETGEKAILNSNFGDIEIQVSR